MRQAISRTVDRALNFSASWGRVCGVLSPESIRLTKRHARNDTPDVLACHDRWGGGRGFRSKRRQRIVRICIANSCDFAFLKRSLWFGERGTSVPWLRFLLFTAIAVVLHVHQLA